MGVDYNDIATKFARSRSGMKWPEIEYFMTFITQKKISLLSLLDVGCGSGRLLESLKDYNILPEAYLGIDMSKGLLKEAQKNFPNYAFQCMNMLQISELHRCFSVVFLIASFHHLESESDRINTLKQIHESLEVGGYVFLTNWYLIGGKNAQKYATSKIPGEENNFSIKFGDTFRYYHGFTSIELKNLAKKSGFQVIENTIFQGERNILTILRKQ